MKPLHKTLQEFYLDYVNNYLTIGQVTLDHDLTVNEVNTLLAIGKRIHEDRAAIAKETKAIRAAAQSMGKLQIIHIK